MTYINVEAEAMMSKGSTHTAVAMEREEEEGSKGNEEGSTEDRRRRNKRRGGGYVFMNHNTYT